MPPKYVGEELRELIKKVRDSTFEYENREEAQTNWAKYDSAQIHEMANYLDNKTCIGKIIDLILISGIITAKASSPL